MTLWTRFKLLFVRGHWFHDPEGVSLYVKSLGDNLYVLKEVHWHNTQFKRTPNDL
jgi:hypothetical protein